MTAFVVRGGTVFEQFVAPLSGGEDYVELGATGQDGHRLFKKHILNKGTLRHPATGETIAIDDAFVAKLKKNFADKVCDIVQVPVAGNKNEHTEDPFRNIGRVTDITEENGKVYATIDAAKNADDLGKTLLGASAMMHLDYTNTSTGLKVGPTLLHVAVTNRPYVTDLEPYQELVKASAEGSDETTVLLSAATETENVMTKDELLAALKEHGVDIAAILSENAELKAKAEPVTELSNALSAAGLITLSGQEVKADQIVSAMKSLKDDNVALSASLTGIVEERKLEKATAEVEKLLDEGRLVPAQKAGMIKLSMTDHETFLSVVPEHALVNLGNEQGYTPVDGGPSADLDSATQAAIDRYVKLGN